MTHASNTICDGLFNILQELTPHSRHTCSITDIHIEPLGLLPAHPSNIRPKTINTGVFDFISQLHRVLQEEKATRQENTILDKEDLYKPYVPNSKIQNIQDVDVFCQTVAKYKDDPEAFVVGLIAYMDKTHATGDGRFTAEPVVMVPLFFEEEEMRKPSRQIILGMITDMERKSSAAKQILDKGSPCQNYHAQLFVILQALISMRRGSVASTAVFGLWLTATWRWILRAGSVSVVLWAVAFFVR